RPARGPGKAEEDADGRGLAAAVGAEEAVDLALGDREVQAVEGPGGAVGLDEVVGLDDRRRGHGSSVLLCLVGGVPVCLAEEMAHLFSVVGADSISLKPTSLADSHVREVEHLEQWIVDHPEILGENVLILDRQFGRWSSTS